ncbi:hypothetical protein PT974_12328 [Cladobotryum mycophilum]|uniref:C2H2-type domain-containing protein n=1 Tax=Cladobotryum mycophilum TaxID=491253 RepID=A0ABR0S7P4_9HYPO
MNEIFRCACSAYFDSAAALNHHVDDARVSERLLYVQYLKSRIHVNADDDGDDVHGEILCRGNDVNGAATLDENVRKHRCPHRRCNDARGYETRAKLRRHYQLRKPSAPQFQPSYLMIRIQMLNARKFAYAVLRLLSWRASSYGTLTSIKMREGGEWNTAEANRKRMSETNDTVCEAPARMGQDEAIVDNNPFVLLENDLYSEMVSLPSATIPSFTDMVESSANACFVSAAAEQEYSTLAEDLGLVFDELPNFDAATVKLGKFPMAM